MRKGFGRRKEKPIKSNAITTPPVEETTLLAISQVPDPTSSSIHVETLNPTETGTNPSRTNSDDLNAETPTPEPVQTGPTPAQKFIDDQLKRLDKGRVVNLLLTLFMWRHWKKVSLLNELKVAVDNSVNPATDDIKAKMNLIKTMHRSVRLFGCCGERAQTTLEMNLANEENQSANAYFGTGPS